MFPVLRPHHQLSAYAHLIARAIEGAMLAVGILFLLLLVPRFMAVWGLVGYAIFLVGAALEVIGYGVSLALSVPGGLFE